MSHMSRLFVLLMLVAGSSLVKAQPVFNFQELQGLYPGKDIVILNQKEHLIIKKNGAGLKISTDKSSEILYLSEKASHLLEKSIFYFDHFSDVRDIEANSWIPEPGGKKLKKISVSEINTRKVVMDNVFYDDVQEKYFTYSSLRKGAVTTLSYSEDIFDPHFLSAFYFGTYAPLENAEFRVTMPDDVRMKFVVRDPSKLITQREERSKNTITYIFTCGRSGGFPIEDDAPAGSYFLPHVIAYIDSYPVDGKDKKILPDVDALYGWYRELMGQMKNINSAELKALSDSLTHNAATIEEKIKNVFYYVQEEIKYIAFEDGLGGFIPREPVDTYNKKFGDCKDKAMLINSLLNQAGIPCYPVWIGTRDIPYSYSEVPTPQSDNHMIAAVNVKDQWVFLDGTSVHLEYGMPTSMIQGKEGLIGISKDSFKIVKVPEMDRNKSEYRETYKISLNGERISGHGSTAYTGYFKQNVYWNMMQRGLDKEIQFINKSLNLGNDKYEATNITFNPGYNNRDSVLAFSYDFVLDDFVTAVDNKVYVNLNLKKPTGFEKIDIEKRFSEKVIDFRNTEFLETDFQIPAGFEIVSLPSNREFNNKGFGYTVKFEKKAGAIRMRREIYTDTLAVTKADFAQWNEFVTSLSDACKELVILKKIKP